MDHRALCSLLAELERGRLEESLGERLRQVEELDRQLAEGRGRVAVMEKRCAVLELETHEMRERVRHEQLRARAGSPDTRGSLEAPRGAATTAAAAAADAAAAGGGPLVASGESSTLQQVDSEEQSSSEKLLELLEAARKQCEILQGARIDFAYTLLLLYCNYVTRILPNAEENELLRDDMDYLQRELEEVQDKFRDDEMDLCRELQRELEATTKMCRVLQFKLRKSEQKLKARTGRLNCYSLRALYSTCTSTPRSSVARACRRAKRRTRRSSSA